MYRFPADMETKRILPKVDCLQEMDIPDGDVNIIQKASVQVKLNQEPN
jgi:hypothetical protein